VYDVVVKKFTFAVSSRDELFVLNVRRLLYIFFRRRLRRVDVFSTTSYTALTPGISPRVAFQGYASGRPRASRTELVHEVAHPGPSDFVQFILEYVNAAISD